MKNGILILNQPKEQSAVPPLVLNDLNGFMDKPRSMTEILEAFAPILDLDLPTKQDSVPAMIPMESDLSKVTNDRHLDSMIDALLPMGFCTDCD
jgi:hypothetical protein